MRRSLLRHLPDPTGGPRSARRRRELLLVFALIFGAGAPGTGRAGPIPFDFSASVATGTNGVLSVAAGDLDGDGDVDLVSVAVGDGEVVWGRNNGPASSFTASTIDNAVPNPTDVVTADLDGDGDLDLVVASLADRILWYENDGASSPGFTRHTIVDTTTDSTVDGPNAVFVADLDGDGDLDVVSASVSDRTIRWHESSGTFNPSFSAHTVATGVLLASSVHAADLDGDGDLDVLANDGILGQVRWFVNDGFPSPCFTPQTLATGVTEARSVYAGDLDGDGDLDVLSAGDEASGTIRWHENDGASTPCFTPHTITTSAAHAQEVTIADVDGDGDLDPVSASFGDDRADWWENDGASDPSFTRRGISNSSGGAWGVVVADLDGDGDLDAATAANGDDEVLWHRNLSVHRSAAFADPLALFAGSGARSPLVVDLDGDGDGDVLVAVYSADEVRWNRSDGASGAPSFTAGTLITGIDGPRSIAAGDLDGDGDLDLATASSGDDTVAWHESDGGSPPAFTRHTLDTAATGASSVFVVDLNSDGDLDVVAASPDDDTVAWFDNDGADDPAFTRRTTLTDPGGARSVVAADLNGDSRPDLVVAADVDDEIVWFENFGGSNPSLIPHTVATGVQGAYAVSVADLDGDGDLDVLSAASVGDAFAWHENNGERVGTDVAFTSHPIQTGAEGAADLRAADLDADGDLDLLGASAGDGAFAWFESDGDSPPTFSRRSLGTGLGASSAVPADLDRDGKLDVVRAASSAGDLDWLRNVGGQYALNVTDVAQKTIAGSQVEDLLKLELVHRGRAGDSQIVLLDITLFLGDEVGDPLTLAEAQALFDNVRLHLDDGDGVFDPDLDAVVELVDSGSFLVSVGRLLLEFSYASLDRRVAFGAPETYFLAVETTDDAASQSPGAFQAELLQVGSPPTEVVQDRSVIFTLDPEAPTDVGTGVVDTALTTASCQAPFDLLLEDRTVDATLVCEAGTTITAGDSFGVAANGDLTLRAGQGVRFVTGFSVGAGGALAVEIDPDLEP